MCLYTSNEKYNKGNYENNSNYNSSQKNKIFGNKYNQVGEKTCTLKTTNHCWSKLKSSRYKHLDRQSLASACICRTGSQYAKEHTDAVHTDQPHRVLRGMGKKGRVNLESKWQVSSPSHNSYVWCLCWCICCMLFLSAFTHGAFFPCVFCFVFIVSLQSLEFYLWEFFEAWIEATYFSTKIYKCFSWEPCGSTCQGYFTLKFWLEVFQTTQFMWIHASDHHEGHAWGSIFSKELFLHSMQVILLAVPWESGFTSGSLFHCGSSLLGSVADMSGILVISLESTSGLNLSCGGRFCGNSATVLVDNS